MKTRTILIGKHEIDRWVPGNIITVTEYVPARVGCGMEPWKKVTGRLARIVRPSVKFPECSFRWAEIEIEPVSKPARLGSL